MLISFFAYHTLVRFWYVNFLAGGGPPAFTAYRPNGMPPMDYRMGAALHDPMSYIAAERLRQQSAAGLNLPLPLGVFTQQPPPPFPPFYGQPPPGPDTIC